MADFTPVRGADGSLADITATVNGRAISLLGPGGPEREFAPVRDFTASARNCLPVFLGAGMGHGLRLALAAYAGPVAVVDRETELLELTGAVAGLAEPERQRVSLITAASLPQVMARLEAWRQEHGGKPLCVIAPAFYQRLNADFYGAIRKALAQGVSGGRMPRASGPRLLLISSKYFLMGELKGACEKLGIAHRLILIGEKAVDRAAFIKNFLREALEFRPDCCITLNHMGVDMEGVLMDILARLQLPLASWFVDNPHLIIHLYNKCASPWTAIFTWDEDNIPSLRARGFEHVSYLPLATDPDRFRPHAGAPREAWRADVSFVGNSMLYKVGARLKSARFPRALLRPFRAISQAFAQSEDRSARDFIAARYPEAQTALAALPGENERMAYETAITWKATQLYRSERVAKLLPFQPLIVGDGGWRTVFRHARPMPRFLDAISYYSELPVFYGESKINFNCTSRQMKGAVNQRVFDAPAAGGFTLTDWRPQMAALFEPDEMACYRAPEEIPDLVRHFLGHPKERARIVRKARKRILACHKWEDRLRAMLATMTRIYGAPGLAPEPAKAS